MPPENNLGSNHPSREPQERSILHVPIDLLSPLLLDPGTKKLFEATKGFYEERAKALEELLSTNEFQDVYNTKKSSTDFVGWRRYIQWLYRNIPKDKIFSRLSILNNITPEQKLELYELFGLVDLAKQEIQDIFAIESISPRIEQWKQGGPALCYSFFNIYIQVDSGVQLSDFKIKDFSGVTLHGARFEHAQLGNANFQNADLQGADFEHAQLGNANFQDADLRGAFLHLADFSNAELKGTDFKNANVRSTILTGATLDQKSFFSLIKGALRLDLSGTKISGVDFKHLVTLRNLDLQNVDFTGSNLLCVTFENTQLKGAVVAKTCLSRQNFTAFITAGVKDFTGVRLTSDSYAGISLDGLHLSTGIFWTLILGGARNFRNTNLCEVNFSEFSEYPNLSVLNFAGARFKPATLMGPIFPRLNFKGTALDAEDLSCGKINLYICFAYCAENYKDNLQALKYLMACYLGKINTDDGVTENNLFKAFLVRCRRPNTNIAERIYKQLTASSTLPSPSFFTSTSTLAPKDSPLGSLLRAYHYLYGLTPGAS